MIEDYLNQKATYWVGETDGFGGYSWSNPKIAYVRWQDKVDKTKDNMGKEVVSTSQVWLNKDLPYRYKTIRLYRGETNESDPLNVDSYEVITTSIRVDIDGNFDGYKVWL